MKKYILLCIALLSASCFNYAQELTTEASQEPENDEIICEAIVVSAKSEEAFLDPMKYTPQTFLPPLGNYDVIKRSGSFKDKKFRMLIKYKKTERNAAKMVMQQLADHYIQATATSAPDTATPDAIPSTATQEAKKDQNSNAPTQPATTKPATENNNKITDFIHLMGVCSNVQPFPAARGQALLKNSKIIESPMGASFNVPGKNKMCTMLALIDDKATPAELTYVAKELYFGVDHTIEELLKEMPGLPKE